MENKYIQCALILNANSYTDKEDKERYNYIVAAKVWNGQRMQPELINIYSDIRHSVGQTIYIKSNKSEYGNIFYTEVKVEDKLMEELPL